MAQPPVGIITALFHPPYGVLQRELGPTLTTGVYQIQRARPGTGLDAFGLSFSFITVPAQFGFTDRVHRDYEVPIVQVAPVYTMLDGHEVFGNTVDLVHEGDLLFFDQLLPTRADVWVQVGCTVTLFFLLAL
jgi:hypothetical protein